MSYSSEVLADSPLAYWKLDETSGSVAADSSGNSRDAAIGGSNTLGVTSLLAAGTGHALGLTADTSNGVSMASASWMNVSAFTIECLVNFSSSPDATNGDAIVSRYGGGGFQWLLWRNFTGKLALQINNATSGFQNVADSATVSLGTTYHVVATWDGSTAKLYVNGTSVGTPVSTTGALVSSTQAIAIGAYSNSLGTVPGAVVDEVSFGGTAISSGRVTARYTAATTSSPDATVTPPAATATASAPAPTIGAVSSATVSPPAATASATAVAPAITNGTGNRTVSPPAATATASAPAPVFTQTIDVATDTSNARDGRVRTGSATVTITRPVAALPNTLVLAAKVDKAIAYPVPTMVDGRPT